MGVNVRRKGICGELEVAKELEDVLGVRCQRNLEQVRSGGSDIQIGRFRIEVKRQETLSMDKWSKQIESAAGIGDIPVVIYRRSREPWRVSLLLTDFMPLMGNEIGD